MAGPELISDYFDGVHPRAQRVTLRIAGGQLHLHGPGVARSVPLREVRWPERQRHGLRLTQLPGDGVISHADGPGWDAWARAQGLHDGFVVRWMQSWRGVTAALVVCLVLGAAAWVWGLPLLSRAVVAAVPAEMEAALGERALASFERAGLAPSRLPAARQAEIREAFGAALARAGVPGGAAAWTLHFRSGERMRLGPNAFALPGGHIVFTDEMAALLADAPDVATGVLAHEFGHVRHRHGLHAGVLTAAAGAVLGDFSSLLAAAPVLLGQQAYSREFEREADAEAARVLAANGIAPARMVLLFERLQGWAAEHADERGFSLPIALASHPADEERIRYFRDAGGR